MTEPLNIYGDHFTPTAQGHGVDISSQRQDHLDILSLNFIQEKIAAGFKVSALDLGGGFGAHSLSMAQAGADVTLIDINEIDTNGLQDIKFIRKNFLDIEPSDIPEQLDVPYSQRAIHYIPYDDARNLLGLVFNRMADGAGVFISAAGYDTEYGLTYPDRDLPVESRFNFVSPEMQEKHAIHHKIVTYKEEDLLKLLSDAGFKDIDITRSSFGNIKASAFKI